MRPTWLLLPSLVVVVGGCSLVTVQQEPYPPLEIQARRPPPPPARVVLTESSIKIRDKVQFEFGQATLKEESFPLLDEVAKVFVDNPQIEVVQVEGHTDATGSDRANRTLSQKRAESVCAYLVSKGVDKKRLVAKGFGEERPIGSNETEEGREQNRRVEFNILQQGPKKTVVQDD